VDSSRPGGISSQNAGGIFYFRIQLTLALLLQFETTNLSIRPNGQLLTPPDLYGSASLGGSPFVRYLNWPEAMSCLDP
jgi:hypothetical protein